MNPVTSRRVSLEGRTRRVLHRGTGYVGGGVSNVAAHACPVVASLTKKGVSVRCNNKV